MATQDTLSEAGCVLPCFFLLSWLLIKQGRVVGHPQLFRADPCHPFRLPLLHGGEQGWGWDPWPPAPLSLSLCQPGGSSSSSHSDSRCVSALLHFSVDEAKLGAWPGCPLHQVTSVCPGPSTDGRGSREDSVFGGEPVACSDIRCGEKDMAPQLDASVTLTSCLQLLYKGPQSPAGQQSISQPCSPGSSQGFGNLVCSMGRGLCLWPLLLYPITGPDK